MQATREAAQESDPPAARKGWLFSIAPAYLGLFVWLAFFDEVWCFLAGAASPRLAEGILDVVLAALVSTGLLFLGLAFWGSRTGLSERPLAERTFGARGARVLTGIGLGLAHLSIYALAIGFAVETTLLGFVACGLIAHQQLGTVALGPLLVRSPVFLTTAAFWIFITATAESMGLAGVIAALMRVYAPTALVVITAVGGWIALQGKPSFEVETAAVTDSANGSFARMLYGLLAVAAMTAPRWGARAKSRRDLNLGAFLGIALPAIWVALVALFAVLPSARQEFSIPPGLPPAGLSFRFVILHQLNPLVASATLLALGLAAVAPAYFACHEFTERISADCSPRTRGLAIWGGAGAAFLMVMPRPWLSLADVAGLLGELVAPLIGAMLAASLGWWADADEPPRTMNAAGVTAWLAGSLAGLALDGFTRFFPGLAGGAFPPAFYGFATAFVVPRIMRRPSRLGKASGSGHN